MLFLVEKEDTARMWMEYDESFPSDNKQKSYILSRFCMVVYWLSGKSMTLVPSVLCPVLSACLH